MNGMQTKYAAGECFDHGALAVGSAAAGHRIAYWQYGNPDGKAAVYLHGGPGAGSSPATAGLFNPAEYRIVLFDQRGCGQSTPHASVEENTTWDLVSDIEQLREHLGIAQWLVCGGSWGSALALAYAQTHPASVRALVLRGIFTLRKEELLWFYQEGASWIFPDLWEGFVAPIPQAERGDLLHAYHKRLMGDDKAAQMQCAKAWSFWEGATLSLGQDTQREADFSQDEFALAFARIENHYFVNGGFWESDSQLIDNAARLKDIPSVIVQGRYDIVTPMHTAWALSKAMPHAQLKIIPTAGHAVSEPGIVTALTAATDQFLTL